MFEGKCHRSLSFSLSLSALPGDCSLLSSISPITHFILALSLSTQDHFVSFDSLFVAVYCKKKEAKLKVDVCNFVSPLYTEIDSLPLLRGRRMNSLLAFLSLPLSLFHARLSVIALFASTLESQVSLKI